MNDTRAYMPASKSQEWETPWWLFESLDLEFEFTVDAAAHSGNAKMERYWTEEIDGLKQDWTGERVFLNPPYAVRALRMWTAKAYHASRKPDTVVVMVIPVKSDQDWWHRYALKSEIRFIRGRVTFEGAKSSCPVPIAVLVFGRDYEPRNITIRTPNVPKRN